MDDLTLGGHDQHGCWQLVKYSAIELRVLREMWSGCEAVIALGHIDSIASC